jgi:hypothetical protein
MTQYKSSWRRILLSVATLATVLIAAGARFKA